MRTQAHCLGRLSTVLAGLALSAAAAADCQTLVARTAPDRPNAFTLVFEGIPDGTREAHITTSEITLEVCDNADGDTARFLDYYQEVNPLTLPGGFDTGALTILVSQSNSVSYTPATGEFETDDAYEIHFTGDLSAFGIPSPFILGGQSGGTIVYETGTSGTLDMQWSGTSFLPNPFEPGSFIPFSYTCQVSTNFNAGVACAQPGCESRDFNADCQVDLDDLSTVLANFGDEGPRVRPADGDTNADRSVSLTDLANVLASFGTNCN